MPACACAACVLVSVQNLATGHLAGASAAYGFDGPNASWQNRHLGPPFHCLPWLAFWASGKIVCRGSLACGTWCLPTGFGDLTVASCMTPKVRSLDGVVCVLLCVGLLAGCMSCSIRGATCRICKRGVISLMKVVVGIKAPKHLSTCWAKCFQVFDGFRPA